ncbi:MAG: hypothetical protein LIP01_10940, partial [Tannerellaceae bacterium]|nr:hypothetical protein [Tannerellaceae bacterium]
YDKLQQIQTFRYTLIYSDGSIQEEQWNNVLFRMISADLEIYSDAEWFVEIDKINKTYIAQEKVDSNSYVLPNALYLYMMKPSLDKLFPNSKGSFKQISDKEYRLNEQHTVLLTSNGLPAKIITPEYVMDIDTLFPASIQADIPQPPAGYFVRILHTCDGHIGDRGIEAMELHSSPREPFMANPELIAYNYQGMINGKEASIYIRGTDKTNYGSAHIYYHDGLHESYNNVHLLNDNSACKVIIKDDKEEIVLNAVMTKEGMKGSWKKETIHLYPPVLSSEIEFYSLYNSLNVIACWNAKSPTGLINMEIMEYHEKLFGAFDDMSEEEWNTSSYYKTNMHGNTYIYCNEMGILCIELYKSVIPEDDYNRGRSEIHNSICFFDLITGKELAIKDILVSDYVSILNEAGYEIREDYKFIILPNGIEWIERYNFWGAIEFEKLFLNWEKLQPIIKPSGPLSPFLSNQLTSKL